MRARADEFEPRVCVTAQHRGLLDQVLDLFGVSSDADLNVMRPGQTLFQSTSRIVAALEGVLTGQKPDALLVQGDTTTTFCGALAGFYANVPVGHVEAGLRTGDVRQPFPEEMYRLMTTRLADLHFAPTGWAAANLRRESVPEPAIAVTGNTGIDAVRHVAAGLANGSIPCPPWPWLDPSRKLILVTAHRRESFGEGIENLCRALAELAARKDVQIAYPVHPNPNVREPVQRLLGSFPHIHLLEPLQYAEFVDLMRRAWMLLTDSGGVQEEAPSLGKPVLVLRNTTERPEAVEAGTALLVGTSPQVIVREATLLLDDEQLYRERSLIHNPFGDGRASHRICDLLRSFQSKKSLH